MGAELPFMATENILMYCVKTKGGDRQELHEAIRKHSIMAAEQVKLYGNENDLIERIRKDDTLGLTAMELEILLDPAKFTGMAKYQCEKFVNGPGKPLLNQDLRVEFEAQVNV